MLKNQNFKYLTYARMHTHIELITPCHKFRPYSCGAFNFFLHSYQNEMQMKYDALLILLFYLNDKELRGGGKYGYDRINEIVLWCYPSQLKFTKSHDREKQKSLIKSLPPFSSQTQRFIWISARWIQIYRCWCYLRANHNNLLILKQSKCMIILILFSKYLYKV